MAWTVQCTEQPYQVENPLSGKRWGSHRQATAPLAHSKSLSRQTPVSVCAWSEWGARGSPASDVNWTFLPWHKRQQWLYGHHPHRQSHCHHHLISPTVQNMQHQIKINSNVNTTKSIFHLFNKCWLRNSGWKKFCIQSFVRHLATPRAVKIWIYL